MVQFCDPSIKLPNSGAGLNDVPDKSANGRHGRQASHQRNEHRAPTSWFWPLGILNEQLANTILGLIAAGFDLFNTSFDVLNALIRARLPLFEPTDPMVQIIAHDVSAPLLLGGAFFLFFGVLRLYRLEHSHGAQ